MEGTYLWLTPIAPLIASGLTALLPRRYRTIAATLAIGSMVFSLALAIMAFAASLSSHDVGDHGPRVHNFTWLRVGEHAVQLGWVLDPLSALMLLMITFVGLLIFVYSIGYMAHDENFTRFFCFLCLFAAAMLGLVISNSLLLLFICWELVGLASYLLIGFWYQKPSAAAAAKKAFITTRIGDLGFLLGIVFLYAESGTLVFYDGGNGCLESTTLAKLASQTTSLGIAVSTGIALLLFCGAIGKSGQIPLHVWLPDAMEGPTPVSALIHAATMVAAGVFLVARVYPLMGAHPANALAETAALRTVTWIGVLTAVFAALIAVGQTDIKRILAYSTVSQLGFMFVGLGTGGVAVGMFHLLTHAFFKALLFLGAGSVIHGLHDEQDIRKMGGLARKMPWTFATYAVGMMALAGVPVLFSGFWSKDEILHAAHDWHVSSIPFYLGLFGVLLTAFYMTRQMCYVFGGTFRGAAGQGSSAAQSEGSIHAQEAHESPPVMVLPLALLAAGSVLLGFFGTPAWPWLQSYIEGEPALVNLSRILDAAHLPLMLVSSAIVLGGIGSAWLVYGRHPILRADEVDPLERWKPNAFHVLRDKFYIDELYENTVVRVTQTWAWGCDWLDRWVWGGAVLLVNYVSIGLSWGSRLLDEYVVNRGFDITCERLRNGGDVVSRLQDGQVHNYLRALALSLICLLLLLTWGSR